MIKTNDFYDDDDDLWDDESDSIDNKYLIVKVEKNHFALKLEKIREIIKLPEIQEYPEMGLFDRGLINLRNEIVRIVDLRKRLHIKTISEEEDDFVETIKKAKQDHIEWIAELKHSVMENRRFRLTNDPHKCKFGMWYDSFQSENRQILAYFKQLEMPHNIIHSLADKVAELIDNGKNEQALNAITNAETSIFSNLINLFDSAESHLRESRREIAVIFSLNDNLVGCTADGVYNIIDIALDQIEPPNKIDSRDYVSGIAKTRDGVILIIDETKIV